MGFRFGEFYELPEHAILCDTVRHKMYVGVYKEIDYFLLQQPPHEPSQLTAQELEEAVTAVESMTLEQMQRLGMFEMFGNTNPQARQATAELAGLKQISSPNKTQTGFVSREYVPIFVQPFDKPKRYGCPKRFKGFCKGV